jgi:hypothetical protein
MNQESLENRIQKLEQQVEAERRKNGLLKRFKFKLSWKYASVIVLGVGIVIAGVFLLSRLYAHATDPVPARISSAVSFPIYLPESPKLPAGFKLETGSFSARDNAVIYDVLGPHSVKLVFTLQKQPSAADIQSFYSTRMPLSIPVSTSVGTAEIGSLLNEQVASLPIINGPWVLVTAPLNFNQSNLKQILQAMTKPQ